MHRVNKVGLHHGVVGMLHGIGCVYHIHLQTVRNRGTMFTTKSEDLVWLRFCG